VLRVLDEFGSPATMAMAGGRFFGFVVGGALPITLRRLARQRLGPERHAPEHFAGCGRIEAVALPLAA